MPKKISEQNKEKIIDALRVHPNAKQVAGDIGGVSRITVWSIAKAEGIELTAGKAARGRQPFSPDRRASVVAALQANSNAKQVARELGGVSDVTVCKIAREAGIQLTAGKTVRGRKPPSPERRAAIIEALQANPNAKHVAREIGGVSPATVCKVAREAGFELMAGKRGRKPLSPDRRTAIIEELAANPNATEVAQKIGGVSPVTVWSIAKAEGVELTAGKAARGRKSRSPDPRATIKLTPR